MKTVILFVCFFFAQVSFGQETPYMPEIDQRFKVIETDLAALTLTGGSITVVAGAGLTGGTITTVGTIAIGTTGVAAGSYGTTGFSPTFTVGTDGRLTSAGSIAMSGGGGVTTGTVAYRYVAASDNATCADQYILVEKNPVGAVALGLPNSTLCPEGKTIRYAVLGGLGAAGQVITLGPVGGDTLDYDSGAPVLNGATGTLKFIEFIKWGTVWYATDAGYAP